MLAEFFAANWPSILLSLVTAGALAFCRWTWKQMKTYRALLEEKQGDKLDETIDHKLEPIVDEIEQLRAYIRKVDTEEQRKLDLIIASYRYRLVQLCKIYLRQGFMTQDQFEQLSEFYKLYHGLGGNGQAEEFYDKTRALPIKVNN
jgi:hypothetical protein